MGISCGDAEGRDERLILKTGSQIIWHLTNMVVYMHFVLLFYLILAEASESETRS